MKLHIVPARTGLAWVKLGIRAFWRQPMALAALFFMTMAAMSVATMIPLVGPAVALAVLIATSSFFTFTALAIAGLALLVAAAVWLGAHGWRDRSLVRVVWVGGSIAAAVALFWGVLGLLSINGLEMWRVGQAIHREYRLNYPAWFLFNLYDLAVFMGIAPFVGAAAAVVAGRKDTALRWLALGWGAAVLLLNLSAVVIVGGLELMEDAAAKAEARGMPMLSTQLPAFEAVGRLYQLGVRGEV